MKKITKELNTKSVKELEKEAQTLRNEIAKGGMRNIVGAYKIIIDTTLSINDMDIKSRQLEVRERELELKEMELKARIDNPDAFTSVTIINDAPKPKDEVDYEFQPNPN